MLSALLRSRRFAPLFWCQFFSAFNDNLLKNGLIALIVFGVGGGSGLLVQIAGALLILPFFFLSGLGGELADRYDKALITRRLKFAEIFAAAGASLGFILHSVPVLMAVLALFGVIAALFGPIKYGILPDHLETGEIPAGNALIEGATFIAILAATVLGTKVAASDASGYWIALLMVGFALLCWLSSLMIPKTGEGAPHLRVNPNILASTLSLIRELWRDGPLWRATLAASWFWLYGALSLAMLATLVGPRLGGTEDLYIGCMLIFSVSIAIGSTLAAWIARGRIVLAPALAGIVIMGIFAIDLGLSTLGASPGSIPLQPTTFLVTPAGLHLALDLFFMALGGGLFIVPVFAALQVWAGEDRRARTIAANNVVNAVFIVAGALGIGALQGRGIREPQLFIGLGIASLLVAVLVWRLVLPLARPDRT